MRQFAALTKKRGHVCGSEQRVLAALHKGGRGSAGMIVCDACEMSWAPPRLALATARMHAMHGELVKGRHAKQSSNVLLEGGAGACLC